MERPLRRKVATCWKVVPKTITLNAQNVAQPGRSDRQNSFYKELRS